MNQPEFTGASNSKIPYWKKIVIPAVLISNGKHSKKQELTYVKELIRLIR
jgi:hypothetical protein